MQKTSNSLLIFLQGTFSYKGKKKAIDSGNILQHVLAVFYLAIFLSLIYISVPKLIVKEAQALDGSVLYLDSYKLQYWYDLYLINY